MSLQGNNCRVKQTYFKINFNNLIITIYGTKFNRQDFKDFTTGAN